MSKITLLGLGAMGSRMANRMLHGGHELTVWNRSPDRANELVERGARRASTPREAVDDAEIVLSMLRDDDAATEVWLGEGGALAAMGPTAIGVECSTLSVQLARRLHAVASSRKLAFVDAPVIGSRPQAEAGQLVFLVGGDETVLADVRPVLDLMGAKVCHCGEGGAGAAVKLVVNALFAAQLAAMGELIGFLAAHGVDPRRTIDIVGATPVCSPAAKGSAEAMLDGRWAPAFPIELVAKDMDLAMRSADETGAAVPLVESVAGIYAAAVAEGYGDDNITGIVQRYAATPTA